LTGQRRFARRGWAAVVAGRLVPGVRLRSSVPAGVAGMPLNPFFLTTAPHNPFPGPGFALVMVMFLPNGIGP